METGLRERLRAYEAQGRTSFHTPGHKNRADLLAGIAFPGADLTELPELDVLSCPQDILLAAQQRAARQFGAEETFFLVNGGTAGNVAMFLTVAASHPAGGRVCVERQAHRSVHSGLVLSGLRPHYILPTLHPDFNLPLGTPAAAYTQGLETALAQTGSEEPLLAWHVTAPSYYGTTIDQGEILRQRDRLAPQLPVLVDQAHGAHWQGTLFPPSAVALGADLVMHSTHKTLSSLTQSALLHRNGGRVARSALRQALEMIQSSSPSYLFMASLEAATEDRGRNEIWQALYPKVMALHEDLKSVYRILNTDDVGHYGIAGLDWSKILVNVAPLGVTAEAVADLLRREYGVEPELWQDTTILFMLGIGSRPQDVRQLHEALRAIAERGNWQRDRRTGKIAGSPQATPSTSAMSSVLTMSGELPPLRLTPRQAWFAPRRTLPITACRGEIAAETIVIYPPGVPLVVAGEELTEAVLEQLTRRRPEAGQDAATIEVVDI